MYSTHSMLFTLQFKHQWGAFPFRVGNLWLNDIILTTEQAPKNMETISFAKLQSNYCVSVVLSFIINIEQFLREYTMVYNA